MDEASIPASHRLDDANAVQLQRAVQHLANRSGACQHTVVSVGDRVFATSLSRCFIGVRGLTYPYMGRRMFSYPAEDLHQLDDGQCAVLAQIVTPRNPLADLAEMDSQCVIPNLVLMNVFDSGQDHGGWKHDDSNPHLGKLAIGWHRDPLILPESSIYVATLPYFADEDKACDFCVAWRPIMPTGGQQTCDISPTRPTLLRLEWRSVYVMSYNFNERHQHAVVAGQRPRIGLVARRIKTSGLGVDEVLTRVNSVLSDLDCQTPLSTALDAVRRAFSVANVVEFEWIRQFWAHGSAHADFQRWWAAIIERLEVKLAEIQIKVDHSIKATLEKLLSNKSRLSGIQTGDVRSLIGCIDACRQEHRELRAQRAEWRRFYDCTRLLPDLEASSRPMDRPEIDACAARDKKITKRLRHIAKLAKLAVKRHCSSASSFDALRSADGANTPS